MTRVLSCGVIVTDGRRVLIGHATRSPRWDIPKGQAEPGEAPEPAARRELEEETGLVVSDGTLRELGQYRYLPRKDLALYLWQCDRMPDAARLVCRSFFQVGGRSLPEFDRFDCPMWAAALPRLGKAMQGVLRPLAGAQGWQDPISARAESDG